MKGGGLFLLLGVGLIGYYVYSKGYFSLGTATPAGGSGGGTTGGGTGSGGGTSAPGYNSLASIAARIQADVAAHESSSTLSVYQWLFYWNRNTTLPAPDVSGQFPAGTDFTTATFTFPQFWSAVTTVENAAGVTGLGWTPGWGV